MLKCDNMYLEGKRHHGKAMFALSRVLGGGSAGASPSRIESRRHSRRRPLLRRGWRSFPTCVSRRLTLTFHHHFVPKYLALQNCWLQFK